GNQQATGCYLGAFSAHPQRYSSVHFIARGSDPRSPGVIRQAAPTYALKGQPKHSQGARPMQEFVILAGLPGSGKSTLARRLKAEQGFFVVSSDAIRLALNAGVYPRGDQTGDYAVLEPIVWKLTEQAITDLLRTGRSVALDATNLTRERRLAWRDLARSAVPDIPVRILWCEANYDSAQRWADERGYSEEEYRAVRQKLEASVERPGEGEGCLIEYHGR